MNDLPECCKCTPNAERAETLYCAYQRGGADDRAGLAEDGRVCPPWAQLLEYAEKGYPLANVTVAKWRAVAESVEKALTLAQSLYSQAEAHVASLITAEPESKPSDFIRAHALEPVSRPFHIKQAGGRDLGVLLGYLDSNGNFHADNGALYGCLYSAEPVEPPKPKGAGELPKLETAAGACVARRLRVEEVTPDGTILFDDGTWANASEWTPANFLTDEAPDDIPW